MSWERAWWRWIPDPDLVATYRRAGGPGPCYGQQTVCHDPTVEASAATFAEQWRHAVLDWTSKADIPTPAGFAQATQLAEPGMFVEGLPNGPGLEGLDTALEEWSQADFTHVAIHNVGADQEPFLSAAPELLELS